MDIVSLCPQGDTFLHICGTKTLPKMVCNVKSKPSLWHFSGKQTQRKNKRLCLRSVISVTVIITHVKPPRCLSNVTIATLFHTFLCFVFFNLAIVYVDDHNFTCSGYFFLFFFFCSRLPCAFHLFCEADYNAHSVRHFPAFKIKGWNLGSLGNSWLIDQSLMHFFLFFLIFLIYFFIFVFVFLFLIVTGQNAFLRARQKNLPKELFENVSLFSRKCLCCWSTGGLRHCTCGKL